MLKFNSTKNYAFFTGAVLFLTGLFGFTFRSSSVLPDYLLILAMAFGLWGLIVSFSAKV